MVEAPITTAGTEARVAQYSLLFELARGGMAQVFIAQRDGATTPCVLKLLHAEMQERESVVRRFYREAHLASFIDHPNIARVVDAGFENNALYIALELINGQTLESISTALSERDDKLSVDRTIALALAVLDGLTYAHALSDSSGRPMNLVHRDLTARNVMVSYDGVVKIIDFGIARGDVDSFSTEPGVLVGTLRYLSPEQAAGTAIDHRADIYSLSVLLYELLSGRTLIPEAQPMEMLHAVLNDAPHPLAAIAPYVPAPIADVVMRGLSKAREDRWSTATEMRDAVIDAANRTIDFNRESAHESLREMMSELFLDDEARMAARIKSAQRTIPLQPSPVSPYDVVQRTRTGIHASVLDEETVPGGQETIVRARDEERAYDAETIVRRESDDVEVEATRVVPEQGRRSMFRSALRFGAIAFATFGVVHVVRLAIASATRSEKAPVIIEATRMEETPSPSVAASHRPAATDEPMAKSTTPSPALDQKKKRARPTVTTPAPALAPAPIKRNEDGGSALAMKVQRLRANPQDQKLQDEFLELIERRAAALPEPQAKTVRLKLHAMHLDFNIDTADKLVHLVSQPPSKAADAP